MNRLRAAYHEAGHAVVAYALGFPIKSITIVPAPGLEGLALYTQVGRTEFDEVRVAMAGEESECIRFRRRDRKTRRGAFDDRRYWLAYMEHLSPGSQGRLIRLCRAETRYMLRQHWPRVEALVAALMREETVMGGIFD